MMSSTLRTLWRGLFTESSRTSRRRRPTGFRPALDILEDRAVPASINYATLFGGNVYASSVNNSGDVYLTGLGFVAEMNPTGTAVLYDVSIGSGMRGTGIAVDSAGDAFVIGSASSVPTTPNAIASSGSGDFVAELNPSGSIVYATILPGTIDSIVVTYGNSGAIAVDGSGNIYVAGAAEAGLPVTANAFQTADRSTGGHPNTFFAKIDPALSGSASLLYATYLGGSGNDAATGIALDNSGDAYLTGYASSTNFPTTSGAFQSNNGANGNDAFVAKINPALSGASSLVYSTYLGGSGAQGYISDGTAVFDGRNDGGIAVDSSGDAYVAGSTTSSNFPTTAGSFQTQSGFSGTNGNDSDVFVTKLNSAGTGLIYSTYIGGGSSRSGAASIAIDSSGDVYMTGWTNSTAFPTKNPVQSTDPGVNASTYGSFVTVLNPSGSSLLLSSYVGGNPTNSSRVEGMSIGLDPEGDVYVAGITESYSNFPTTPGAYDTTGQSVGFVLEITAPIGPSFTITGPTTVSAGTSGTYTLTTLNPNGTIDTAYSGTVAITSGDPKAVLPGDVTITNGVGTFNVILETAGTQSVAAADVTNPGMNGADTGIVVTPAAASQVIFTLMSSTVIAGQTLGTIQATIEDAYGNVETGDNSDQIAVSVNSGPSMQLGGTVALTVSSGVATFSNLMLDTSGTYTLAALVNLAGGGTLGPVISPSIAIASPVSVSLGTITYNSKTGLYSETVTLTNTTGSTLTGPMSLELTNLPSGVTLTDETGTTNSNPFVRFLNSGKTLKKGAATSITLTFTAANLSDITFGTEVVVGQ